MARFCDSKQKRGLTLVELIVVLVILAVLAALLVPSQQLSQPVNSLHPSSYTSFHGGHPKFFSKTFTMFFLMSSVGSLNFIPFVNS